MSKLQTSDLTFVCFLYEKLIMTLAYCIGFQRSCSFVLNHPNRLSIIVTLDEINRSKVAVGEHPNEKYWVRVPNKQACLRRPSLIGSKSGSDHKQ